MLSEIAATGESAPKDGSFREAGYAVGIAALSALSFPPIGLWPLSLAAVCLFLRLIRNANTATARNLGLIYGFGYGMGTMYWFFGIFHGLALLLIALFAAYFCLFSMLVAVTRGRNPFMRAVLVGMFAVAMEWVRGDAWYLRFPWYTVPHALAQSPAWIAPARWLGTYGFSFAIWFLATWGALQNVKIWAALLLFPACALLLPDVKAADQKALLLQTEARDGGASLIRTLPSSFTTDIDLAILPEYACVSSPQLALDSPNGPAALAQRCRCPVVFGAKEEIPGSDNYFNVAVILNGRGEILNTFPKQRPVPLFRDGLPGTRRPVIPSAGKVLGVAVCYDFDAPEIAATLVNQGATVLIAPTYDSMNWGRTQHVHHELLARLRAVENERWLLRCASSGRSEVIDPRGRPSSEGIEIGETGAQVFAFALEDRRPLGSRFYFLGPIAVVGTCLFLVAHGIGLFWQRQTAAVGAALIPGKSASDKSGGVT